MNAATYARRNLFRRPGRTILMIVAVAIAVLIFCLIRTVVYAWNTGVEDAATDRIATRHKISYTMELPKRYFDELRSVPGVKAATWANWFGAKDPKERVPFFAGLAVDPETWFEVEDEMSVPPEQLAEWKKTPNGAILGDVLAKKLEVQVGSRLVVKSDRFPGRNPSESDDWEFKVVGIYTPLRKTADRNTLIFRWDFLNNDPRGESARDKVGWMLSRISDPIHSADVQRKIDDKFGQRDDQTVTMSERAFQLSFLGGFGAVLRAYDFASLVILLIMTMVIANAMAMNSRERTHEYGVLRAIGFSPRHIAGFIVGESLLVAVIGGAIGIGLVALLINRGIGPLLEDNSGIFPYFRTPAFVLGWVFAAVAALGAIAGAVPAYLALRLKVTDSLRRVG